MYTLHRAKMICSNDTLFFKEVNQLRSLFLVDNYTSRAQSPMNTIPNGHHPEWARSRMAPSRMSTYLVTECFIYASLVRSFCKDAFNEKLIFYVM